MVLFFPSLFFLLFFPSPPLTNRRFTHYGTHYAIHCGTHCGTYWQPGSEEALGLAESSPLCNIDDRSSELSKNKTLGKNLRRFFSSEKPPGQKCLLVSPAVGIGRRRWTTELDVGIRSPRSRRWTRLHVAVTSHLLKIATSFGGPRGMLAEAGRDSLVETPWWRTLPKTPC